MTQEIQQEQTERTEMERKTLFPLLAPVKNVAPVQERMHPLFEKASGLTESTIAAAIERPAACLTDSRFSDQSPYLRRV
jgi:hypothetical protein